jgi:hypothetical protein
MLDPMVDPSDSSSGGSTGSGSIHDDVQQVKGFAFETMRLHLTKEFGEEAWEALMDALPRQTQVVFREAEIAEWYAEAEMRRFIHVLYEQLAERDDERFKAIARGVALAGVNRFFRMILSLASARFVLRKVPVFWQRIRQGPAVLVTELAADGRVLIHYQGFRYCRDPICRLLSIANCQALVLAATGKVPAGEVIAVEGDSMTLAFTLDE